MIYRTRAGMRLWDTWMLREGGQVHLFTLSQPVGLKYWDRVCHAVSSDLIHWEDWDDIVLEEKADRDAWDAGVILTGSAFKCPRGYGMTYGAVRHGDRVQRIGVIFSRDLRTWEKHPGNPVLVPQAPYYEHDPQSTTESSVAWRDAYVVQVQEGYEAFIAANDAGKAKTVNGCVARAFSKDLTNWELLPPMASPGRYVDMEVPQYFELNGCHYLLFSTGGPVDLPSRVASGGTYYLMAESKYGQYRAPDDNLLIGSGESRFDCYVGKVMFTDDGPLLYHHIIGKRTALAAPKMLHQDREGNLWLERWKGLDALLGRPVLSASSPGAVIDAHNGIPIGDWTIQDARVIGDAGPAISGWLFDKPLGDCSIQATIDLSEATRAGVLFRIASVEQPRPAVRGLGLCFNRSRGVIQLCEAQIQARRSVQLKALDNVYVRIGDSAEVEIFLRAEYAEIYCDNRPFFVLNAGDYPLSGGVGFFVDRGRAAFEGAQAKQISAPLR